MSDTQRLVSIRFRLVPSCGKRPSHDGKARFLSLFGEAPSAFCCRQAAHYEWHVLPPPNRFHFSESPSHYVNAILRTVDSPQTSTPVQAMSAETWDRFLLALDDVSDTTSSICDVEEQMFQPSYLWDGLIPRYSLSLLVGAPKLGKSTLLREMLRAGQSGGTLLGCEMERFKALVVSEETLYSWGRFPLSNTVIDFLSDPPVRTASELQRSLNKYATICRVRRYDVLVFDSLSRLVSLDENSARAATRVFAPIRDMIESEALTVLVVHHAGRSGTVRGSTAIEAQADTILSVERRSPDTLDSRRVLSVVGRMTETREIEYQRGADGSLSLAGKKPALSAFPSKKSG